MEVSVIVPTYNRGQQILNLVEALENQTYRAFEVIVFNDGTTDAVSQKILNGLSSSVLGLKVIHSENLGRSGARNKAVSYAKGEVLVFFDDDTRPNPLAVQRHVEFHESCEGILNGPSLYDESMLSNNFSHYRMRLEHSWVTPSKGFVEKNNCSINGGNFSIRKEDFLKIGGFSDKLSDKEDFKLAFDYKYHFSGKVYSCYEAWVYHDDFRGYKSYIQRMKETNKQAIRMLELFPEVNERYRYRYVTKVNSLIKRSMYKLLSLPFWDHVIAGEWVHVLPIKWQDKLYSVCITARTGTLE